MINYRVEGCEEIYAYHLRRALGSRCEKQHIVEVPAHCRHGWKLLL